MRLGAREQNPGARVAARFRAGAPLQVEVRRCPLMIPRRACSLKATVSAPRRARFPCGADPAPPARWSCLR